MTKYAVKELYYTIQGEGIQAGRPAVFLRFAGCNLWSGREDDRTSAVCQFCDTDFVGTTGPGGGLFTAAADLAGAAKTLWPVGSGGGAKPFVVCTGGEPLLQLDAALVEALHAEQFDVAVETNGTQPAPPGLDWICVSPKAGADVVLRQGDELKVVFPQDGIDPAQFHDWNFRYRLLQPLFDSAIVEHTAMAVAYCKAHPEWRLSLQTHRMIGIP